MLEYTQYNTLQMWLLLFRMVTQPYWWRMSTEKDYKDIEEYPLEYPFISASKDKHDGFRKGVIETILLTGISLLLSHISIHHNPFVILTYYSFSHPRHSTHR